MMKAEELDQLFDEGEDITPHLDFSTLQRPAHQQKKVSIHFPEWMLHSLDREAQKIGVTRQAIIKTWIAERLQTLSSSK
jgi:hypothetical protein